MGEAPRPVEVRTADDLSAGLRTLRAWAGNPSYRDVRAGVVKVRQARGVAGCPGLATVHAYFRPGHQRLDVELVVDIVLALGVEPGAAVAWRQACEVIAGRASEASIVEVACALPQDSDVFVARSAEFRAVLDAARASGAVVISGMPGVGKTRLAVRIGNALVAEGHFAELQVFADLRGHEPGGPAADTAAVLDGLLRVLGVPGDRIQRLDLAARSKKFRQLIAGRRALLLFDNVGDEEHVAPLIPETPGCLTLVTSRRRLENLPAVRLEAFTHDEAMQYLRTTIGPERVDAELTAAEDIVELCGCLPLDLAVATPQIRRRSDWSLEDHLTRLRSFARDERARPAFTASYDKLGAPEQRTFRAMALHPGSHFTAFDAAALTGTTPERAAGSLRELHAENLLQRTTAGRYHFHDLTRTYAARLVNDEDSRTQHRAATERLVDRYLGVARTAVLLTYPYEAGRVPPGTAETGFDTAAAKRWFDAELATLVALPRCASAAQTIELSAVLDVHLRAQARNSDALFLHERALEAAGTPADEAGVSNRLGGVLLALGRTEEAVKSHRRALEAARAAGDRATEGTAWHGLGDVHRARGEYRQAGESYTRALAMTHRTGHGPAGLRALSGLADTQLMLGRYDSAQTAFLEALTRAKATGHTAAELDCAFGLGLLHQLKGELEPASEFFRQVLATATAADNQAGRLKGLRGLGLCALRREQYDSAAQHYEEALAIARTSDDSAAQASLLCHRGGLLRRQAESAEATECYREAWALAVAAEDRNIQFEALYGLGRTAADIGNADQALARHQAAYTLATELNQPADQVRALDGMARAATVTGAPHDARKNWEKALRLLAELGCDAAEEVSAGDIRSELAHLATEPA